MRSPQDTGVAWAVQGYTEAGSLAVGAENYSVERQYCSHCSWTGHIVPVTFIPFICVCLIL
jgi:hypothetical protein